MFYGFLLVGLIGVLTVCGWSYWQVRKTEERIRQIEAEVQKRSRLVGEAIDEVLVSIHQMYREMDRCLIRLDQAEVGDVVEDLPETDKAALETPAVQEVELEDLFLSSEPVPNEPRGVASAPEPVSREIPVHDMAFQDTEPFGEAGETDANTWSPYTEAIQMAAKGMDYVEIARHIDMGIEELRLLLQFRGQHFTAS